MADDKGKTTALTTVSDNELLRVLQNSLYPGAKSESVSLVLGYCAVAKLDPMLKPVHIVPMSMRTGEKDGRGKDVYAERDVIMPGIGLYRTTAARTGNYAGKSEPEFGPTKKLEWSYGDNDSQHESIDYPEWCRVTVHRLVDGKPCAFTAVEYWLENYATAGRYSKVPNAMWKRRPYAQLAKCAEAQALRQGFPEVGAQPTADELEGHQTLEPVELPAHTPDPQRASAAQTPAATSASTSAPAAAQPAADLGAGKDGLAMTDSAEAAVIKGNTQGLPDISDAAVKPDVVIDEGKVAYLRNKTKGMTEAQVASLLVQAGVAGGRMDWATPEQFDFLRSRLV